MEQKDESFEDLLATENSRVTIEKEREEIASYKQEIETLEEIRPSRRKNVSPSRRKKCFPKPEKPKILPDAKEYRRSDDPQHHRLHKSSGVSNWKPSGPSCAARSRM